MATHEPLSGPDSRRTIAPRGLLLAGLALCSLAVPAGAQATHSPFAVARGVVYDSVGRKPLAGARVSIVGTNRVGVTEDRGDFVIDSVPPGEHMIEVWHPVLDTMGVQLVTKPIKFEADRATVTELAIPSAAHLGALLCPTSGPVLGDAMLFGRISRAGTDSAIRGAIVEVVWRQLQLGQTIGLRQVDRVRRATTDSSGYYRVCGLPRVFRGTVQARSGGTVSGDLPVEADSTRSYLTLFSLHIGVSDTVPTGAHPARDSGRASTEPLRIGPGVIKGRVTTVAGLGIAGAEVRVAGGASVATSDERGAFTLSAVPTGTQALVVRRVGYAGTQQIVDLPGRIPLMVEVKLSEAAVQLPTVKVESHVDTVLKNVGFLHRRHVGNGFFATDEEIKKRPGATFTDLFDGLPMVKINVDNQGNWYLSDPRDPYGGCVNYYLDGVFVRDITNDEINKRFLRVEIGALEVYRPSFVPMAYTQPNRSGCVTIVVWTKSYLGK